MNGISWTDLDPDEQRTIAMLGAGYSAELCDAVALLTLARLDLVKGLRLTPAADQMRKAAILAFHFGGKSRLNDSEIVKLLIEVASQQ